MQSLIKQHTEVLQTSHKESEMQVESLHRYNQTNEGLERQKSKEFDAQKNSLHMISLQS